MAESCAYIEGVAIWSERLPGWDSAQRILREEIAAPEPASNRPSPDLLPPNERRRAPDTVAISLEVASKACANAQRDPAELPSVFASTHGDLAITDYMCQTLASTPEMMSPTRFHNSVHNAAAGYWAIATGSMQPYTAISADRYTFGNGLLEALVQAQCDSTPVLLVAYDTEAKGPLATVLKSSGRLACALVVNCQPSDSAKLMLRWQMHEYDQTRTPETVTPAASFIAGNAMAHALPAFAAIARCQGNRLDALPGGIDTQASCAIGPTRRLGLRLSAMDTQSLKAAP
ncbi:MAG: beta-ketoacyl synthase chain length factor [Burkholderiales bacterium]|jgi:hypothetical protein